MGNSCSQAWPGMLNGIQNGCIISKMLEIESLDSPNIVIAFEKMILLCSTFFSSAANHFLMQILMMADGFETLE